MIFNTVLNGSWWFYPSLSDFIGIVILTLITEVIIIGVTCNLINIKEKNISTILVSVFLANLISAIIGYIILFSGSGG